MEDLSSGNAVEVEPTSGSPPGWLRSVRRLVTVGGQEDPTSRPVVDTEEVYALLNYAATNGVASEKVRNLSIEAHKDQPDPSTIAVLYADLVSATHPVTGRTVLHSRESLRRMTGIAALTLVFFVLAAGNYIADSWLADLVEPEDPSILTQFIVVKRYVLDYLTPFFWGGLGACVFLLKKVQDAARDQVYDRDQMEGWGTRVLIGGVLAAIILILFDPSTFVADSLPLRPAAIAFLVGLGVKAVYGALESLIDVLAERLQLENLRRNPVTTQDARSGDRGDGE